MVYPRCLSLSMYLLAACGLPDAADGGKAATGGTQTNAAAFFLQYDGKLIRAESKGLSGLLQDQRANRRSRLEALLEGRASLPGVRFHVSERLREPLLSETPRYVFSVTTGHVGSTSLSSRGAYAPGPLRDKIDFHFEDLFDEDIAWQRWWHGQRRSLQEQIDRTARMYKPHVDRAMAAAQADTYVDLGHHNVHGILGAIPAVFADDAFLVRVRRARLRVAHSFDQDLSKRHGAMCVTETALHRKRFGYRLCPLTNEALLRPAGGATWTQSLWSSLSQFQQALWYIDELEAEWQRLLASYPDVGYLDCDWVDDLRPCFEAVAAVLGLDVADQEVYRKNHTHGPLDLASLRREDRQYRRLMGLGD